MTDPSDVRVRCRELRKRGLGLILFAFPQSLANVASYNYALNSVNAVPTAWDTAPTTASDPKFRENGNNWDNTVLPGVLGTPAQQPHTINTLARLKPTP